MEPCSEYNDDEDPRAGEAPLAQGARRRNYGTMDSDETSSESDVDDENTNNNSNSNSNATQQINTKHSSTSTQQNPVQGTEIPDVLPAGPSVPTSPDMSTMDPKICIACLERRRVMVFRKCGHMCLCEECFHRMNVKQCPVCQKRGKAVKVFLV
eukprot:c9817_g1_i3.p1 GENE.c9817_g1_i3~~c9817_g1_i3.p1  ORF type:complete len:154 (+),score=25.42 c9817_g1_i3:291-752(+)